MAEILKKQQIGEKLTAAKGSVIGLDKETRASIKASLMDDIGPSLRELAAYRTADEDTEAVNVSLAQYVNQKWGFACDETTQDPHNFYTALGINPNKHTVEKLFNMSDQPDGFRWIIPEIFREAVRLGLRDAPMYPNWIASDETVTQPLVTVPKIDKANATAKVIGEATDPEMGLLTFGQRKVELHKIGVGINVTDEVIQYSNLAILSLHLQDIGVNMGLSMDTLAIDILINGDQTDGSMAAPTIGVQTMGQFAYRDFLHPWFRMGRLGRMPNQILSGENAAIDIVEIPEFKALAGTSTLQNIQVRTPIPTTQDLRIHGAIPAGQFMLIDGTSALIKMTSAALKVESERIVMKQINGTMVSTTTGFANLITDARVLVDNTAAFSGFPATMDIDEAQNISIFSS